MKKFTSIILSVVLILNIFCTLGITVSAESIYGENKIEKSTEQPSETSGTTGDCAWSYDTDTQTLTISGNGEIGQCYVFCSDCDNYIWCDRHDYGDDYILSTAPWRIYQDDIKTIIIDAGVTSISRYAFLCLHNLETIKISNSVTNIDYGAFYECEKLNNIFITDIAAWLKIPKAFSYWDNRSIENEYNLYLNDELVTDIEIPENITEIETRALVNCKNLKSVTIPKSVVSIGYNAFPYDTKKIYKGTTSDWAKINFAMYHSEGESGGDSYGHNLYINNQLPTVISLNNVENVSAFAFRGAEGITEIVADVNLKSIGSEAFLYCPKLNKITIPSNISLNYAFKDCYSYSSSHYNSAENVTEINIVDGSTEISNDFHNLVKETKINSIIIPNSFSHIPAGAFSECTNINQFDIPNSITYIGAEAFSNCLNLKTITIPREVTRIEYTAFSGCTNLTIKGYKGSYAETYAILTGIPFEAIIEDTPTIPTQSTQPTSSDNWVVVKAPTCEESGVEVNYATQESRTIPALGHKLKTVNKKAATYFAKGYTGDKKCTVCGKVISKGKTIAKLKLGTPKVKITAGKKKLMVKYTKVKNATGFQVKYTYKGKTKTKTYSTKKSVTKVIKKLKKGTYKVKVRALIKSKGRTAYSNWTKAKKYRLNS